MNNFKFLSNYNIEGVSIKKGKSASRKGLTEVSITRKLPELESASVK